MELTSSRSANAAPRNAGLDQAKCFSALCHRRVNGSQNVPNFIGSLARVEATKFGGAMAPALNADTVPTGLEGLPGTQSGYGALNVECL